MKTKGDCHWFCMIAQLIVMLLMAIFCTCVDTFKCDRTCYRACTVKKRIYIKFLLESPYFSPRLLISPSMHLTVLHCLFVLDSNQLT